MLKIQRFKINSSNSDIDYIKPKVKYNKNSTVEEVMIKFRKKT